jgi:hypothetical protein
LFAGLDLDGRAGVLEAEEQGAGVFEVLGLERLTSAWAIEAEKGSSQR